MRFRRRFSRFKSRFRRPFRGRARFRRRGSAGKRRSFRRVRPIRIGFRRA